MKIQSSFTMGHPSGALRVSDICALWSCVQKVNFVNWYVYKVNAAETEPAMCLFSAETRFQFIRWGNSQNTSDWSARETTLICKMSLHDVRLVCGVLRVRKKLWGCFYLFVYKYSESLLNLRRRSEEKHSEWSVSCVCVMRDACLRTEGASISVKF